MKLILSVDVQKKENTYHFTLHHIKKVTVIKSHSIADGFRKVQEIIGSDLIDSKI